MSKTDNAINEVLIMDCVYYVQWFPKEGLMLRICNNSLLAIPNYFFHNFVHTIYLCQKFSALLHSKRLYVQVHVYSVIEINIFYHLQCSNRVYFFHFSIQNVLCISFSNIWNTCTGSHYKVVISFIFSQFVST